MAKIKVSVWEKRSKQPLNANAIAKMNWKDEHHMAKPLLANKSNGKYEKGWCWLFFAGLERAVLLTYFYFLVCSLSLSLLHTRLFTKEVKKISQDYILLKAKCNGDPVVCWFAGSKHVS